MLIDQDYPDILSLRSKPLKGGFDRGVVRLAVNYEEVLLRVWWCCDVLRTGGKQAYVRYGH